MTAGFAPFTAFDSAWRPAGHPAPNLSVRGEVLAVELRRWAEDETVVADTTAPEEVGAVLEGRFELRCGEELYVLAEGQGIVIPPGAPRRWRALAASGVLYRVFGPPLAAREN